VADGLFYAELNEFLMGELGEDGYSGVEVRVTPMRTEVRLLFAVFKKSRSLHAALTAPPQARYFIL